MATPWSVICSRQRVPWSSSPRVVASTVSWPSRAMPMATLAGEPPTCSATDPSGVWTMSTRVSPTTRTRGATVSVLMSGLAPGETGGAVEHVVALDDAHGAGLAAHDDRVGRGAAAGVAHTLEQLAVGDAGADEEAVVARYEVVGGEDRVEVVTGVDGLLALVVVLGPEAALDDAAEA